MDSYEEKAMADIRGFEEDFLFAELEVSITQFEKKCIGPVMQTFKRNV